MKHLLLSEGILVLFVLSSVTLAAPPGRDPNSCEGCPVPYAACDIPHEACSPWDGKAASKEAARQQAESNLKSYLRQQCDDRFLVPKGVDCKLCEVEFGSSFSAGIKVAFYDDGRACVSAGGLRYQYKGNFGSSPGGLQLPDFN